MAHSKKIEVLPPAEEPEEMPLPSDPKVVLILQWVRSQFFARIHCFKMWMQCSGRLCASSFSIRAFVMMP